VLSDAVAWSLQNRMLMRVEDPAAWTGTGPRTAEQIMRWMRNIRDVIAGGHLHYTCIAADHCDASTWAWVIPGQYRVNLCRTFWRGRAGLSAETLADFQALTIVHEVSHIYYDTEDSGRGPGAAECIAQFVGDVNNVPLDRDFVGRCGPQGPSEVQAFRGPAYGRVVPGTSFALQLQSSRFQGDPVLEQIADGRTSLHVGSRGDAVRRVQEALRDLGYEVAVDGAFGNQTAGIVRQFQQAEGLGADGVVGRNTLGRLDSRFATAASSSLVRVRRDITSLSATEISALADAINELKRRRVYHNFVRDHANSMPTAHRQPAFLPWHRSFILNYESELRAIDSSITLPYWDWTNDPGVVGGVPSWNSAMSALLGGNGDPRAVDTVTTGPFASWTMVDSFGGDTTQPLQRAFARHTPRLPTLAEATAALGLTPYDAAPWDDGFATTGFRNNLEGWANGNRLHNVVHVWVGGAMLPGTSPNDPVFFLHHAMVDRLFAQWQAANPGLAYEPATMTPRPGTSDAFGRNDDMPVWDVTSTSAFTVKPIEMWDSNNLRDHLGTTGIQVSYA
jgi:tyrosinase